MFKLILPYLIFTLLPSSFAASAVDVERIALAQTYAIVVTVDLRHDDLQLFLKSNSGKVYQSFQTINQDLASQNQQLAFAMNAGMFHPNYLPVGLYVEQSKNYFPLNLDQGWGNFFMQPNGVFFKQSQHGLQILSSADFADKNIQGIKLATQSGPLLVYHGVINPLFKPDSSSRVIRNAVGIVSRHEAKFVITEQPVSFYELADFFKNRLDIQDALYLDGSISSVYLPALNRHDHHRLLGPIIGVVQKSDR